MGSPLPGDLTGRSGSWNSHGKSLESGALGLVNDSWVGKLGNVTLEWDRRASALSSGLGFEVVGGSVFTPRDL